MSQEQVNQFLKSYLNSRCKVSSQHKLPTESEIKTVFTKMGVRASQVDKALNSIELKRYGPYISDHQIDVV